VCYASTTILNTEGFDLRGFSTGGICPTFVKNNRFRYLNPPPVEFKANEISFDKCNFNYIYNVCKDKYCGINVNVQFCSVRLYMVL